ncbi:MAG: hypothetical protein RL547_979, partial [Actinomycetota bacterium]
MNVTRAFEQSRFESDHTASSQIVDPVGIVPEFGEHLT